ncbi:MAG TPA: hypothetical protein VGD91_17120 [Trebonia sp.]
MLAVAAVAGCANSASSSASAAAPGGGTASADVTAVIKQAAGVQVTSVAGTTQIHLTTASGATSGSAGTAGVTEDITATFSERLKPSLTASFDATTLTVNGKPLPGGISEVLTPSTVYLKSSELTKALKQSRPWLSVSTAQLGRGSGINIGQLLSGATDSGPASQNQMLAGASAVHQVGTSTLDGVPVTEYTGTIDIAKAIDALPAADRAGLQRVLQQAGLTTEKFTAWIDGAHRVRKSVVKASSSKFSETATTAITSVNQPVTVTVPPASETAPLSGQSLQGGLG